MSSVDRRSFLSSAVGCLAIPFIGIKRDETRYYLDGREVSKIEWTAPVDGKWHHLVAVKDGTFVISEYWGWTQVSNLFGGQG